MSFAMSLKMSLEENENIIRVHGSTTQETTKEKSSIQEQIVLLMKSNPSITVQQIAVLSFHLLCVDHYRNSYDSIICNSS